MTDIIFLRHGESEGVRRRVLQGHADYPLTDAGRAQVRCLAEHWQAAGRTFDRILTSPLRRARETAEIVAACLGIDEVCEEPLWIERDFGQGEGVSWDRIADWYAGRARPTAFEPIYETGESEWQAHLRAGEAVEKLMSLGTGRYLVVSHGNIINAALHVIFGILPGGRGLPAQMALEPAGCAELHYDPETGRWRLVSFNDRSYLSKQDR